MRYQHEPVITQLFEYVCMGNQHAIKLGRDLWEYMHFYDDVIDKESLTDNDIHHGLNLIMFDIPNNPLYLHPMVQSVVRLAVSNWIAANSFEKAKEELEKAYMLRAFAYNLFIGLANIVGGQEWANECAPVVWKTYGEKLEEFKEEVHNA